MSCSEEEVHYNDIGSVFLVTVKDCVSGTSTILDVSTASSLSLVLGLLLEHLQPRLPLCIPMAQMVKFITQQLMVI